MSAHALRNDPASSNGIVLPDEPFELVIDYRTSFEERVAALGDVSFGVHLQKRRWPIVGEGVVSYEARHFQFPDRPLPALAVKQMFLFDEVRPWLPAVAEHLLADVVRFVQQRQARLTVAALWARRRRRTGEYLLTAQMGDGKPAFVPQEVTLDLMASTWCLAVRERRRYAS